jgi:hypothetical protein
MTHRITLGDLPVSSLRLHRPSRGCWTAWLELEDGDPLDGQQTLVVDSLSLVGTVTTSGTFAGVRKLQLVGGYGGWQQPIAAHPYHKDVGVSTLDIIVDAARDAGEILSDVSPSSARTVGVDYLRQGDVPASTALDDAAGTSTWWINPDGTTSVGVRPQAELDPDAYNVLNYDAPTQRVTLDLDDLGVLTPGCVLREGLDQPLAVVSYTIELHEQLTIKCDCAPLASTTNLSPITQQLVKLVNKLINGKLTASYRYRVIQMQGDRVECQIVRKAPGLPDAIPVSMWSAPGIHAELTEGSEVMVMFEEGNRSLPYIHGHAPHAYPGHVPAKLVLADGTKAAARVGDDVEVGGVGTIVTFTPVAPSPSPTMAPGVPYLISFDSTAPSPALAAKAKGTIVSGSDRVDIG